MDYWESRFRDKGLLWGIEPSDSAIVASEIFKKKGLNKILIPGFGYGRNARPFLDSAFEVTGIEISESAIKTARENHIDCSIRHGSVTSMPFDNAIYDAVFCYALIHLLNKHERRRFLSSCFRQLRKNGMMVFVVSSKLLDTYGRGKSLSKDRFEIETGLKVFYYDSDSVVSEYAPFGLVEFKEIEEPVKFMESPDSLKLFFVVCEKSM